MKFPLERIYSHGFTCFFIPRNKGFAQFFFCLQSMFYNHDHLKEVYYIVYPFPNIWYFVQINIKSDNFLAQLKKKYCYYCSKVRRADLQALLVFSF